MATMEQFHRDVAAGNAMREAGNLDAAIRHCKAALDINPTHVDVYELQIDILRDRDRPEEALRITKERLERVPDCRWANIQQIRLQAGMGRSGFARQARDQTIELFADDPMMVHDANLMYDTCLDRNRAVLKRIKQLRQDGYWGVFNLDQLEQISRANAGHVGKLGKLQQQDLEDGRVDADTLASQAVVRYLQGRLLSARKLASQAMDLDPANAPIYAETKFAATLGLIPLFWPAQLFIITTGSLTARFPWFVRIFTNYALAFVSFMLLLVILAGFELSGLPEAVYGPINVVVGFGNIGWALYVVWAFGSVGRWRARKRDVGLSSDY